MSDNFCRSCGHQLTVTAPVTRPAASLQIKPSSLPKPLVGSMAVLALGTGLEWLARRAAGSAARAAGRALIGQSGSPKRLQDDVTVDEVLYVRKVQLRR